MDSVLKLREVNDLHKVSQLFNGKAQIKLLAFLLQVHSSF
jgi:hypothetical protein